MKVEYAGFTLSKTGKIRNEDCILVGGRIEQQSSEVISGSVESVGDHLIRFAIADGVGSMPKPHLASRLLLTELIKLDELGVFNSAMNTAERLRDQIVELAVNDAKIEDAATTLITAELYENFIQLWHAGDSRAYLLKEGDLEQLTKDQTILQSMLDSGDISYSEAVKLKDSHFYHAVDECFIYSALSDTPLIQSQRIKLKPNETLLLASDGLHASLSLSEIQSVMSLNALERGVSKLAERCKREGAKDDVSVIAINLLC